MWNRGGSPFLEIVHTCCEVFLLFFGGFPKLLATLITVNNKHDKSICLHFSVYHFTSYFTCYFFWRYWSPILLWIWVFFKNLVSISVLHIEFQDWSQVNHEFFLLLHEASRMWWWFPVAPCPYYVEAPLEELEIISLHPEENFAVL